MRVHCFQHVPFEGLGLIEPWLRARGHEIATTRWWAGEAAPAADDYDWLIVMGGPMNIYQHRDHPWLVAEKVAIAEACAAGKRVLGVCLGAQLIADALGGKVFQNAEREIGWWPLCAVSGAGERFRISDGAMVLHWHGDTYSLPPGARRLAESAACAEQAFAWGARVLGLQFHVEMDARAVAEIAAGCADELRGGGRWVQSAEELAAGAQAHRASSAALLDQLLTAMDRS